MPTAGENKTVHDRILAHAEVKGALLGQFRHLHIDIYGNRNFVEHLRNRGKVFDSEVPRLKDLLRTPLHELMTAKTRIN